MKAVLIGTDYLEQGDSVKILEINTNAAIFNDGVSMLDFTPLFDTLVSNNITEFHYIFTEGASAVPIGTGNKFKDKLEHLCSENNISFTEYEVPRNSITVPDIEDGDNKFILRQSYDTSAILDSSYTSDKFEFFSLMSGSSYIPKTYFSSSEDSLYLDTLDTIDFERTNHPNLVEKERNPIYDRSLYPKLSIVSESVELTNKKNSLNSDSNKLLQEFVYDEKSIVNGYWSVIRSFDIIYGGNLDIVNLGGYKHSAPVPLDFNINELIENTFDLNQESRIKYINKNLDRDNPIPYHTDLESTILMYDDTLSRVDSIIEGDIIKTVKFDTEYNQESSSLLPWQDTSTIDLMSSSLEFISSSLISKESQTISTLLVKITLDGGEVWKDTPGSTYYIEESGSNDTLFVETNKLLVGDKIISIDKNTKEVSKKEITSLDIVFEYGLEIFNLDFEPQDYFLVDIGNDAFVIMHNVCTGCSWASCGDYWCDNTCIGCGFGGGQK